MKPAPFAYIDPESIDEALELLDDVGDEAAVIAGGQSLVPLLNLRLARPRLIIDLRRISELSTYEIGSNGLHAGAMVRACQLLEDPGTAAVPGLRDALACIGHSQIRSRTTVGGSVAHADPSAELPALLVALDGVVTLRSRRRGERTIEATGFFLGPFTTAREPDELVTSVSLPASPLDVHVAEVTKRPGDFAMAGAIVGLGRDGETFSEARICLFGVADRPVRITAAELTLTTPQPRSTAFATAVEHVRHGFEPSADVHVSAEYRRHVAAVLVGRALESLT